MLHLNMEDSKGLPVFKGKTHLNDRHQINNQERKDSQKNDNTVKRVWKIRIKKNTINIIKNIKIFM